MNAEASTKPDSITPIATPEQLIAAREARGLSMSDVAAKLGMMPRQIAAIEEGRWEALPGQAFIRGAIRAYGKALQVDIAPLLATIGGQGSPELRASSSLDSPLPRHGALGFDHGGSGSRIVWILLGVIGVVAIAMYFGRGADLGQVLEPGTGRTMDVVPLTPDVSSTGSDAAAMGGASGSSAGSAAVGVGSAVGAGSAAGDSSGAASGIDASGSPDGSGIVAPGTAGTAAATTGIAASPSGSDAQVVSSPTLGDESSASAAVASTSSGAASETADAARSVDTARSADTADAADPSAAEGSSATSAADGTGASTSTVVGSAAATRADSLVMRFERESWVEVRDATGRVLLLGTQPANSMREVSGEKPYSMTIGNASFVRVEHEGRNVDLGNVTQKGVARLRVE